MKMSLPRLGSLALGLSLVSVCAWSQTRPTTRPTQRDSARASIRACNEGDSISGELRLKEVPSAEGVKQIKVTLAVEGMRPGKHAVHIHEVGVCEPCGAAKGHFDPGPHGFSSPDGNHPFHMGDLINIEIGADGKGRLEVSSTRFTLSDGPLSLFDADGSSVIIHVDPDTYCPEGEAKGCAGGARAACGIIRAE